VKYKYKVLIKDTELFKALPEGNLVQHTPRSLAASRGKKRKSDRYGHKLKHYFLALKKSRD
jgi:hypothetical protein